MPNIIEEGSAHNRMGYRSLISFCLMSLIPILCGVYVTSLFIPFPFVVSSENLARISVIILFSFLLSLLGYKLSRQWVAPMEKAVVVARKMAQGEIPEDLEFRGSEEIDDLSRSLKAISMNARELLEKVEKLTPKDKLTGLYNLSYIRERLDEEIQRAAQHQHPCSFAYLRVAGLREYATTMGEAAAEEALKKIAQIISEEIAVFDRAARVTRKEFVVILPNRNKKKAIEIIERLLSRFGSQAFAGKCGEPGKLILVGGISENPMDGVSANELYMKAEMRMKAAKEAGKFFEAFDFAGPPKT